MTCVIQHHAREKSKEASIWLTSRMPCRKQSGLVWDGWYWNQRSLPQCVPSRVLHGNIPSATTREQVKNNSHLWHTSAAVWQVSCCIKKVIRPSMSTVAPESCVHFERRTENRQIHLTKKFMYSFIIGSQLPRLGNAKQRQIEAVSLQKVRSFLTHSNQDIYIWWKRTEIQSNRRCTGNRSVGVLLNTAPQQWGQIVLAGVQRLIPKSTACL